MTDKNHKKQTRYDAKPSKESGGELALACRFLKPFSVHSTSTLQDVNWRCFAGLCAN